MVHVAHVGVFVVIKYVVVIAAVKDVTIRVNTLHREISDKTVVLLALRTV